MSRTRRSCIGIIFGLPATTGGLDWNSCFKVFLDFCRVAADGLVTTLNGRVVCVDEECKMALTKSARVCFSLLATLSRLAASASSSLVRHSRSWLGVAQSVSSPKERGSVVQSATVASAVDCTRVCFGDDESMISSSSSLSRVKSITSFSPGTPDLGCAARRQLAQRSTRAWYILLGTSASGIFMYRMRS